MPIYEYDCKKCAKVIEVIQKFSDAPLTVCPTCQGPVEKKISMTSFQLKGTGWYATDYKKSPSSAAPTPIPKADGSKSETKTESKAESAPAAAETTKKDPNK